jgi:uncharacterized damage-inducible protein DinB
MPLRDLLLPEWDVECGSMRRVLERLPEDRYDWQPHARSWSAAHLAGHLANIAEWGVLTLTRDSFDLAPPGAPPFKLEPPRTRAELLARFDTARDAGRAALAAVSDEQMQQPWSLLMGGKTFRTWPRYNALRMFVLNHAIHHRGQLSLYLRLMDVPVPSVYGPTADEPHL